MIERKIDFLMTIKVEKANPNGDPLAENMPRTDARGFGEISDVCIKRKIRNRMQDMGKKIFVMSTYRSDDDFTSLEKRFGSVFDSNDDDKYVEEESCKRWMDVRAFGQVITFQKRSIGIRGPVSIAIAKSLEPVEISTMQITRSVNGMEAAAGKSRSSDTMGSKHFVEFGVYLVQGSVNCYYAEKTGFSEEDLEVLKESLRTLFVNDLSSARPDGSMEVKDIYWFEHSCKIGNVSSAKIKDLVEWDLLDTENIEPQYEDYNFRLNENKLKEYEGLGLKISKLSGI